MKYLKGAWVACQFPVMFVRALWVARREDARYWKGFRRAERTVERFIRSHKE